MFFVLLCGKYKNVNACHCERSEAISDFRLKKTLRHRLSRPQSSLTIILDADKLIDKSKNI